MVPLLDGLRSEVYSEGACFAFYQYIAYRLGVGSDEDRGRPTFTSYQVFPAYENIRLSAMAQLNDRLDHLSESLLQPNLPYHVAQQYLTRSMGGCVDSSSS